MINMFNLNLFKNIGFLLYLFVYLIFPYSAITQTLKVDFIGNLENSFNAKDLEFIRKNFINEGSQNIPKQFSKIINDFPNSKWKIKRLKSNIQDEDILRIKVSGEKIVNGEIYILESKFDYLFSIVNGKISEGIIKNLFTTIRNDNKKIDISFKIPDRVLTGSKYDIDIILNKPLEEVILLELLNLIKLIHCLNKKYYWNHWRLEGFLKLQELLQNQGCKFGQES